MQISETFQTADKPQKTEAYDVRKEAEHMIRRHERQMQRLRLFSGSREIFREASLKATEVFKVQLKTFLEKNGAGNLYAEMVGFLSGKIGEVIGSSSEKSSLN